MTGPTMPDWFVNTFLFEAVGCAIIVTGCFFMGMLDGAVEFRQERQAQELAAMSDEELHDLFFDAAFIGEYSFGMVYDEYDKRCREAARQAERCKLMQDLSEITYYADNVVHTVVRVPSTYGTVERR